MKKTMTREEMIEFIKANPGVKITHELFDDYEYIYLGEDGNVYDENDYLFEDWHSPMHNGIRLRIGGNWEYGWSVYKAQWEALCNEALQELREGEAIPETISLFNPTLEDVKTKIKLAYAIAILKNNPAYIGWMLSSRLVDVVKNAYANGKFTEDFDDKEHKA